MCVCAHLIHLQHVPVSHTRLKHYSKHYKQWVLLRHGSWQLSPIYWPPSALLWGSAPQPTAEWFVKCPDLVVWDTQQHLDGHGAEDELWTGRAETKSVNDRRVVLWNHLQERNGKCSLKLHSCWDGRSLQRGMKSKKLGDLSVHQGP